LPNDSWIIEGGIGYLDSSIDEPVDIVVPGRPVNSGVAKGNQLPFAPEMQWNLGIGYTGRVGSLEVSPRVDVSYSDAVYFDASNTTAIAQLDSYTLLDVSIAFERPGSNWKAVLGVNNATDEDYRISGNSSLGSGSGYSEVAYARPRVAFANFTYEF
jgi:iron complex outermembrane receptor protein